MPINPNIALSVQQFQAPSAVDSYGKAMSLKSMIQQQKMQDMQMQDYEQGRQDKMRLRDLARSSGGDHGKFLAGYSEIDPLGGMQAQAEYQGTMADNESKQIDLELKRNKALFQILGSARDQNSWDAAASQLSALIGPDKAKEIYTAHPTFDPDFVSQGLKATLDADKQLTLAAEERKAGADQKNKDRDFNLEREKFEHEKGKPVTQPEVKLTNFLMPDGKKITVPSNDANAINQAIQNGGIETGLAQAVKPLSPKETQTAKQKVLSADILLKQIGEVEDKFNAISGTMSTGKLQGWTPTQKGEAFDLAVDNMRSTVTGLQKVPGLGSMSDYETRLDQSKMPKRGNYEENTTDQIRYIKDYANAIKQAYSEMLGESVAQPNNAPNKESGASGAEFSEGQTATNPQTGQKLIFKGGQWQAQ